MAATQNTCEGHSHTCFKVQPYSVDVNLQLACTHSLSVQGSLFLKITHSHRAGSPGVGLLPSVYLFQLEGINVKEPGGKV